MLKDPLPGTCQQGAEALTAHLLASKPEEGPYGSALQVIWRPRSNHGPEHRKGCEKDPHHNQVSLLGSSCTWGR